MADELNMNDKNNAYTIVSVVFFLPYAFFQPVATVVIREIGPRRFLAAIVLCWGATMIVSHIMHFSFLAKLLRALAS